MPTHAEIMARLRAMAEPKYAKFSSALIPNCPPMLGVRLPALRAYARELARALPGQPGLWDELTGATFEERMLVGMLIGVAKLDDDSRRGRLERFLPLIDNWSVCDSAAAGCKFMARAPDVWLPWLRALAMREEEFSARFGVVCLLDHFTGTPDGRRETLAACAAVASPAPYARLGVAWAVSVVAVREPALGLEFLRADRLDAATHNKAIRKIRESRRAAPDLCRAAQALRRKP